MSAYKEEWLVKELAKWPEYLRDIGRVLFDIEKNLSDGYEHYVGEIDGDNRWDEMVEVAEKLYQAAHGNYERPMELIDRGAVVKTLSLLLQGRDFAPNVPNVLWHIEALSSTTATHQQAASIRHWTNSHAENRAYAGVAAVLSQLYEKDDD